MEEKLVLLAVLVGLGTFALRALPIALMSEKRLPPFLARWLTCIPVAVLSALVIPELLLRDGKVDLSLGNPYFWVSVPIFFLALKTRSIGLSVVVGMATLAGIRLF